MKSGLFVFLILLAVVGCTAKIDFTPNENRNLFSVEDRRSPEQKAPRRDSSLSAVAVLGDENVQPPAVQILQSYIQKHQKHPEKVNIVISDFAIIDFFPKRMSHVGSGGWLTKLIVEQLIQSKTDWSYAEKANIPKNVDSVICFFAGQINGKTVQTIKYSSYQASPFAGSIRGTKEFQEAVLISIEQVAQDCLLQSESETKSNQ